MNFKTTVKHVDLKKFMKQWFVIAGRTTFLENGAHNSVESYSWNEMEKRIDVDFRFNKGSFDGEEKTIPQKAWVEDAKTNATWSVQPFWPLKFGYLVLALDPDYKWTAIGVPSGRYLWIMASEPEIEFSTLDKIKQKVFNMGYPLHNVQMIPQQSRDPSTDLSLPRNINNDYSPTL